MFTSIEPSRRAPTQAVDNWCVGGVPLGFSGHQCTGVIAGFLPPM
jgi:hypothetical protein